VRIWVQLEVHALGCCVPKAIALARAMSHALR
jgi:hypothetical protein